MIRRLNEKLVAVESGGAVNIATIYCNSTDEKPTDALANGSKLIEVDTGAEFLFDEENSEWVEVSTGGGGGGGSANKWYRASGLLASETPGDNPLKNTLGNFIEEIYGDYYDHYADLMNDISTRRVNAYLTLTFGEQTGTLPLSVFDDMTAGSGWYDLLGDICILSSDSPYVLMAGNATIAVDRSEGISVGNIYVLQGDSFTNLTNLAAFIPYTLDIYVHDKPSTPDEEIPYNPPED